MKRFSLSLLVVVVGALPAWAGLFNRGIGSAMEYGPYTGGHAYSYNVAYSYGFAFSAADTWRRDYYAYPAGVYPYRPYGQPIFCRVFPQTPGSVPPISVQGEDGLPILVHPGVPPTALATPAVVVPGPMPALHAVPVLDQARAATIRVVVPYNAQVWLEKEQRTETGMERVFTLPPLTPGKTHIYTVRAAWTENGRPVEQVRVVGIRAGETAKVNFLMQR
jgi:uncharacterized protein (TIGR03000 family)